MNYPILVLGNGFDLYHKLPTRYTDFLFLCEKWTSFYECYIDKISAVTARKDDRKKIGKQFDISLGLNGELIDQSIKDFAECAEYLDNESMSVLGDLIQKNKWLKYFDSIGFSSERWIDFEREIEQALIIFNRFFEEDINICAGKILSQCITTKTLKLLKVFAIDGRANPIIGLGVLQKHEIDSILENNQKQLLIGVMKQEMEGLNKALMLYFREFVSIIKINSYSQQLKLLGKVNILSFNYTDFYRNIYSSDNVNQIHLVHGSVENNDMVLGIGDDVFDDLDYVYFQKYFQRIQKKTGSYFEQWIPENFTALEDTPIKVYIIGHSLDKTDKTIFDRLFLNVKTIGRITIFYHNQLSYEKLVIALIDMYGKDFVIKNTATGKICFEKLLPIEESNTAEGDK